MQMNETACGIYCMGFTTKNKRFGILNKLLRAFPVSE